MNDYSGVIVMLYLPSGEWRHGLRSGEGEHIAANGTSYSGMWQYDKVMM